MKTKKKKGKGGGGQKAIGELGGDWERRRIKE
jgi:hypothetical protein